jgi:hypothetical protein
MKYLGLLLIIMYFLILNNACQSFLEQDISDKVVVLQSPPDSMFSSNYNQVFWWGEIAGATSYNLQVVSPSFDYAKRLVLDTTISTNQFAFTCYPDTFAWRVKARNPAYETAYSQAVFYIDSTEGPQIPTLNKPDNNTITRNTEILFSWYETPNATNYRILVDQGEDIIISRPIFATQLLVPDPLLEIDMLSDGEYTWSVRAENEVGWSEYATKRNLMIDRIAPEKPIINNPAPWDTISEINISWTRPLLGGSPITDSLFVYKDSTGLVPLVAIIVNDTVYRDPLTPDSWYRCKVKSVDKAGNEGLWSTERFFYYATTSEEKKK